MTTKINSFKRDERSDYNLTVKYKNEDYPLNFKSAAFDDCFEFRLSGYKNAKENERVMIDLLNKEDDFLKVIAQFLDSRIELGRKEIVYNLSIRHTEDRFERAGYSDDTRVYNVGKYQIWKRINTDQKA